MAKESNSQDMESGEVSINEDVTENISTDELEKAFSKKKTKGKLSAEELTQQLEKAKSDYLYLKAEFDNFRKNAIKERSDLVKYGAERFIRHILSVIDNFDRALAMNVNSENFEDFKQGIELTANEFKSQLENMGVRSQDPLGENFDPNFHEALSSEETDKYQPGQISQVFQKAYLLHDRIIRPAQVVVARELSKKTNEEKDVEDQS